MAKSAPTDAIVEGVLWMTVSALTVAVLSAMAKFLEDTQSSQMLFFQMAVSTMVFGAFLLRQGRQALKTNHIILHLVRGLIVFGAWYVDFVAIDDIPLMDAALLSNSVPLWAPLIAWAWLRQRPPLPLWGGILLGTAGVVLVLQSSRGPEVQLTAAVGQQTVIGGTLLALLSGILGAVGFVAVGILGRTDSALLMAFSSSLIATVAATPYALREWQTPDPLSMAVLIGIGLVFAAGSYASTLAVRQAPAAIVTPVCYASVVFTMLIDLVFWNDPPDAMGLMGAALVIVGGTLAIVIGQRRPPATPSSASLTAA
ncbi:MAG: rane protein [Chloroflexi bacterium]|nr:rane protein [Chloroflexota bacterium]